MKKFLILLFFVATFSVAGYSQIYHYDVNGDGVVTAADVTALYDYMLGNVSVKSPVNHDYVDLGLPSGTLWATMNVGANTPEEYGYFFFAWGETTPKDFYDWSTYKWCMGSYTTMTKYCTDSYYGYNGFVDNKTELDPEDDAATAYWGLGWCMPSSLQMQELIDNCTTQRTTRNGVTGLLFTSNINGASLFLPAAGDGDSDATVGIVGCYWTRTLHYMSNSAWQFLFIYASMYFKYQGRYQCNSVRPVRVSYDVNGDGNVTAADVTALYDYMLGNVPSGDEHEYVDLGLPSGTLWATMNVGANSPEEYGDYFAWGETTPKDYYDWSTYKWCMGSEDTMTKYCTKSSYGYNGFVDNKTELDPEDDAAYVNWGPDWRMPSLEQIHELMDNCTTLWTTRNGVNGRLFTSNINGASLFLPAAGCRWGSDLDEAGTGIYWSRTLEDSVYPSDAWILYVDSGSVTWGNYIRNCGRSVRAVRVVRVVQN